MFPRMTRKGISEKLKATIKMEGVPSRVRKIVVAILGGTVLLIGIALIVLPGPAFVVIPIGLAILGTEFAWAKRYVEKARDMVKSMRKKG